MDVLYNMYPQNTRSLSICDNRVISILYGRFSLEQSKIYFEK